MKTNTEIIKKQIGKLNLTHFFTCHPVHLRYITGFTGSAGLCVLSADNQYFVTDGRYREQAELEIHGFEFVFAENSGLLYQTLRNKNILPSGSRVAFESDHVTVNQYEFLKKTFPTSEWVPVRQMIETIRMTKTAAELEDIKKAVAITETVFGETINHIQTGISESEIAAQIGYLIRKHGGQKEAFDVIVASGPRSSLPHARPTDRKLESGDAVILDFGAVYNGYHADMTRTVFLGTPSEKQRQIYERVKGAVLIAQQWLRPGVPASQADAYVRNFFKDHQCDHLFLHSLGHGIGLEIHEAPLLGSTNSDPLLAGHVFTIEPGLYLPGEFGVRIENDYCLTEQGAVNLMRFPETLLSIPERR